MKQPTNFSYFLSNFLTKFLPCERGLSNNTISSYRDSFILLLKYCKEVHSIKPEYIDLSTLNKELVSSFLNWLENNRGVSVRTRNQRLAAIHSFFRYMQEVDPSLLHEYQKILTIPFKKAFHRSINYLSLETIKAILAQPDTTTLGGRRDAVLLSLMYDTGARVQEMIDLKVRDIRIGPPATVRLTGKGNKTRIVPLMQPTADLVGLYIKEKSLLTSEKQTATLFTNRMNFALTRAGVAYILNKHFELISKAKKLSSDKISPHVLRHSKAMHLLQAGVNLVYIRDILGHVDLKTTEIYARIDGKMKREALEKAFDPETVPVIPSWKQDKDLLRWLYSFNK
ncbi:MAG: site-specific integrase [Methanosarcinaceae archaeon]